MGCFLGCFGFSNSKRKRRKQPNRVQPRGDQIFGSYEPLDSAYANLDVKEKPLGLDSELKDEGKRSKEPFSCKIRKKVSFNLNVQTYEPIPKEEDSDDSWGSHDDEERESQSLSKGDSTTGKMASYPSNYRYRNCVHSYDEEDEIAYEESDLDDDDDDEDDYDLEEDEDEYEDDIGCLRISQEEVSEKLKSLSVNRDSLTERTNRNARNRSEYVHSVLTPVENLSQWKAVKAKAIPPVKRQRKENVLQEIAVDASLSKWLSCESKNSENISSFPWRSREDDMMPILDFTSLKA